MPKKNSSPLLVATPAAANSVAAAEFSGKKLDSKLVAQLVVDLQHSQHRPTAHTKTRGEVAGSTKKPWRQKGTGRARVGTKRTPLWRGGGRIFGPRSNRNFYHKINRGLLAPAMTTLLADKAMAGEVFVLNELKGEITGKTKAGLQLLREVLDPQSNLVVMESATPELVRAMSNLPYIKLRSANQVNLLEVALARHIIFLPGALSILVNKLK